MLGASIADPDGVEEGGYMRGMELLPIDTVLKDSKTRLQTSGEIAHVDGVLSRLQAVTFWAMRYIWVRAHIAQLQMSRGLVLTGKMS